MTEEVRNNNAISQGLEENPYTLFAHHQKLLPREGLEEEKLGEELQHG
jgi:hypothetical protein